MAVCAPGLGSRSARRVYHRPFGSKKIFDYPERPAVLRSEPPHVQRNRRTGRRGQDGRGVDLAPGGVDIEFHGDPGASGPRPRSSRTAAPARTGDHGTAIISNQEQNETIVKLAYPSGKIIWSFGHPGRSGTAPGYLNEPGDAYLLKDGHVTVADAQNCRVLVINANRTVAHQIGTDGVCVHHPPASMGSPNGDTPLADCNHRAVAVG